MPFYSKHRETWVQIKALSFTDYGFGQPSTPLKTPFSYQNNADNDNADNDASLVGWDKYVKIHGV